MRVLAQRGQHRIAFQQHHIQDLLSTRSNVHRHNPSYFENRRFEVCGVGLGDAIDSGSAVDSVDIYVDGH